jgi:hypothetical protein
MQERQEPIPTGGFWGVNVLPASRRQKEETRISSGHFHADGRILFSEQGANFIMFHVPVPKGLPRICPAVHCRVKERERPSPEGTAEKAASISAVPSGLAGGDRFPALKRRAILGGSFGTERQKATSQKLRCALT